MKNILLTIFILLLSLFIYTLFIFLIFNPIFKATSIIFPYSITEFDICLVYPHTWQTIKKLYLLSCLLSFIILFFKAFSYFSTRCSIKNISVGTPKLKENLNLLVGFFNNSEIYIPEKGLFQNILVTGTIGTGKTSAALYPFTEQLIRYKSNIQNQKIAMLILDVKGNYHSKVKEFCYQYNRENDLITIDLHSGLKYNPLDKPNLSPIVLANRLKTILTLFSSNNSESYWLDKAEQILSEAIKFCRLYNNNYVTFLELHKLIMFPEYYYQKLKIIKENFLKNKYNKFQSYDLLTSLDFFEKEFFSLDARTLSILKSEISRITGIFVSDYSVSQTFCPQKKEINFHGFSNMLNCGKIIILNMNIAEYKNLSKIIAAYLKLDFQSEVLSRLKTSNSIRTSAFISDEYQEYITSTDADFYAQSREAKCINIVATQSYTSLLNTLKDESTLKVILQNLINKFWFRTDDILTIEEAQKIIGKEDKFKISTTISENAKETDFSLFSDRLISQGSSISESFNKYTQTDFIFDTNFFTQNLETFTSLAFLSDGYKILPPQKIHMIPYFKKY